MKQKLIGLSFLLLSIPLGTALSFVPQLTEVYTVAIIGETFTLFCVGLFILISEELK